MKLRERLEALTRERDELRAKVEALGDALRELLKLQAELDRARLQTNAVKSRTEN